MTSVLVYGQKTTFDHFLNQFRTINCFTAESLTCTADTVINLEQVEMYLPIPPSACNLEKDKNWRSTAKWSTNNHIVVCVDTYYDRPCEEEGYPWFEDWLVSYDKEGHVIDYIQTIKCGDRYDFDIHGTDFPTKISFMQATTSIEDIDDLIKKDNWDIIPCDVEFFDITIDENGHFHKKSTQRSRKCQKIKNRETNVYDFKFEE